ncbi:MAG: hypothetical protein KatS3mg085_559 [Candidatus Dojkabacteria bacterium]|nr:MAG: hypothetical protein KatS3mg085_559 [Candidatus Dojkabacteria bacterium]
MYFLFLFSVIFCELLLLLFLAYYFWSNIFSAPFYPSSPKHLEEAIKKFNIDTTQYKNFVDVGSGDGRIVRWASSKGFIAHGIEINPFFSFISKIFRIFSRFKHRQKFINKNFFKVSFENFDIAYLYLYPEVMEKLETKIFSEMKPGSLIISNSFSFKHHKPIFETKKIKIYKV